VNHFASTDFWFHFRQLPEDVRPLLLEAYRSAVSALSQHDVLVAAFARTREVRPDALVSRTLASAATRTPLS
jgi:hypothetical protein